MRGSFLLAVVLLFFVASIACAGTTGKISGTVRDQRTGDALPSVNVVVEGTRMGAATNVEGYFVILNVPPGRYRVVASLVGFKTSTAVDVRVDIDQTTEQNFTLLEESIAGEEVTVIATRPVVQRDVAASRLNIESADVQKLPVTSVTSAVSLQAGIQGGLVIRGGSSDQSAWVVDGATLREARSYSPSSLISLSAVQDIQVQTGGFTAEYGDLRSGVVSVVTREGDRAKYSFSIQGRYRPVGAKHFGPTFYDPNSYWIRPYVDDAVAWTGTKNGAWDPWTQKQYPEFEGWNSVSQKKLANDNPDDDLSPEAAQRVFLWEHRQVAENQFPDWDVDLGFGGPVPYGEELGNLRFFYSYRKELESYMIPLSRNWYEGQINQLRLTSDLTGGIKISGSARWGISRGTNSSRVGDPGIFRSAASVARGVGRATGSYIDARIFAEQYFCPTSVSTQSQDIKVSHAITPTSFYEVLLQHQRDGWNTWPGRDRDTSRAFTFGNSYATDEAPFGYYPTAYYNSTGITGLRTAVGFANSRDTSVSQTYRARFDLTSQMDKYNQVKGGVEFRYTDLRLRYGNDDLSLRSSLTTTNVSAFPWYFSAYLQDKLEFELMIATFGLRFDILAPNADWYDLSGYEYNTAFTGTGASVDQVIPKSRVKPQVMWSPRLNVSFPVTDYAKLFFNYGHFRQIPTPIQLFRLRTYTESGQVTDIADPRQPVPVTISYEIGYEHSLFDEYMLRAAGYYKDEKNYPLYVTYVGDGTGVDYDRYTSNGYRDKRGFELSAYKNRGNWIQGFVNYTYMVTTAGYFGTAQVNENNGAQRKYERNNVYQEKPVPQPYARLNLDFFTPPDLGGSDVMRFLLSDWRINLLAGWNSGVYITWAGGGTVPGLLNNVQWRDSWYADMRIRKAFKFSMLELELFADIFNVLNLRQMEYASDIYSYGFYDGNDFNDYMKSLHLKDFPPVEFKSQINYINIPGDDRPGDYREPGVAFQPIVPVQSYADLSLAENQQSVPFYYVADEGRYYRLVGGGWQLVDQGALDKVLDDKAYIDMPNLEPFWFLNPRNIFFGMRISLTL